jgi:DNA-binding NtrC family response regulator
VRPSGSRAVRISNTSLRQAARQFEKEHILQQLEACQWNRTRTAKILGIQRKTLYLKMKQLNLTTLKE